MKTTELIVRDSLPQLPTNTHPVVGTGLVESDLILSFPQHWVSPSQAMQEWLSGHRAEQTPFQACYWMKPHRDDKDRAVVLFMPTLEPGKHQVVGITRNDPIAARIFLANSRAGRAMGSIRWELYADPHRDELLDMGAFHQWDLLKGISADRLQALAAVGVKPEGDWDFHKIIWRTRCSTCGSAVGVNDHVFNIDSVVCAECGNRPFLARTIHHQLDDLLRINDRELMLEFSQRTVEWLAGVRARFNQVRRDSSDKGGARLQQATWGHTLVARATDPEQAEQVRSLIEQHGVDFGMYQAGCRILRDALLGKTPFKEEHQLVMKYVLGSTQLIQQRRLTTAAESS